MPMTPGETLRELRRVADQIADLPHLMERRNELIRMCARCGFSQRRIAEAARLSQARVHQILSESD